MKSLWSKINSPLPGWLTLILLCGTLTAHAALPSFSASWITANAAATPSPAVTGFYGPAVIAQATAAPTAQPGTIKTIGPISGGGLITTFNANTAAGLVTAFGSGYGIANNASTGAGEQDFYTGNSLGRTAAFYYNNAGTGTLSSFINNAGTYTVGSSQFGAGFASVNGPIAAGEATGAGLSTGDVGASRSTTTGAMLIGGSSSAVTCDYGVTNSGVLTCNQESGSTKQLFSSALSNSTTTEAFVPPVYTAAGASVASTLHGVLLSAVSLSSVGCSAQTGASSGIYPCNGNFSVSGAAAFTSSSTWQCTGQTLATTGSYSFPAGGIPSSGTSFQVTWFSDSNSPGAATFTGFCFGT